MIAAETLGNSNQKNEKPGQLEHAIQKFNLSVTFIDDNSVHVRDDTGNELAFEFPTGLTDTDEYDNFVRQMGDEKFALPPIDKIRMSISPTLVDPAQPGIGAYGSTNSPAQPYSWARYAYELNIPVDELKSMYLFAREQLYQRFKSRLRRK